MAIRCESGSRCRSTFDIEGDINTEESSSDGTGGYLTELKLGIRYTAEEEGGTALLPDVGTPSEWSTAAREEPSELETLIRRLENGGGEARLVDLVKGMGVDEWSYEEGDTSRPVLEVGERDPSPGVTGVGRGGGESWGSGVMAEADGETEMRGERLWKDVSFADWLSAD